MERAFFLVIDKGVYMMSNNAVGVSRDTVRRIPGAGRGKGTATGRQRVTVWYVSGYL